MHWYMQECSVFHLGPKLLDWLNMRKLRCTVKRKLTVLCASFFFRKFYFFGGADTPINNWVMKSTDEHRRFFVFFLRNFQMIACVVDKKSKCNNVSWNTSLRLIQIMYWSSLWKTQIDFCFFVSCTRYLD